MEEKEVVVEKRTVRREEPLVGKTTNVNIGPEGTTNVQDSGTDVVEEEHVVEEHRRP